MKRVRVPCEAANRSSVLMFPQTPRVPSAIAGDQDAIGEESYR